MAKYNILSKALTAQSYVNGCHGLMAFLEFLLLDLFFPALLTDSIIAAKILYPRLKEWKVWCFVAVQHTILCK